MYCWPTRYRSEIAIGACRLLARVGHSINGSRIHEKRGLKPLSAVSTRSQLFTSWNPAAAPFVRWSFGVSIVS